MTKAKSEIKFIKTIVKNNKDCKTIQNLYIIKLLLFCYFIIYYYFYYFYLNLKSKQKI